MPDSLHFQCFKNILGKSLDVIQRLMHPRSLQNLHSKIPLIPDYTTMEYMELFLQF
jgi:hypothetical protein